MMLRFARELATSLPSRSRIAGFAIGYGPGSLTKTANYKKCSLPSLSGLEGKLMDSPNSVFQL
jgi:hypothetical protein